MFAERARPLLIAACAGLGLGALAWLAPAWLPWNPRDDWHAFVPVTANVRATGTDDAYREQPEAASEDFLRNAAVVLDHYHVPFEWRGPKLYVKAASWSDGEWMMNMTLKARDGAWLEAHRTRP